MPQFEHEWSGITTSAIVTHNGGVIISQQIGDDAEDIDVVCFVRHEQVEWLRKVLAPNVVAADGIVTNDKVKALKRLRDDGNPISDRDTLASFAGVTDAYAAGWREGIRTTLVRLGLDG